MLIIGCKLLRVFYWIFIKLKFLEFIKSTTLFDIQYFLFCICNHLFTGESNFDHQDSQPINEQQ